MCGTCACQICPDTLLHSVTKCIALGLPSLCTLSALFYSKQCAVSKLDPRVVLRRKGGQTPTDLPSTKGDYPTGFSDLCAFHARKCASLVVKGSGPFWTRDSGQSQQPMLDQLHGTESIRVADSCSAVLAPWIFGNRSFVICFYLSCVLHVQRILPSCRTNCNM